MVTVVFAHIAGMPVEETLLSVGPALVAAVSVGIVHIRSLRDRPSFDPGDQPLVEVGVGCSAEDTESEPGERD
ncbi:MAG: hypothetical protein QOD61_318 [Solirubrobacteraceae bacterium]|jgi:hypothetical protein|nr:hypothetical protein [Solirubrobacteraceae bacterium]MEA2354189.1 hypothetical protein [Solirubrobacteraceae bacterium]